MRPQPERFPLPRGNAAKWPWTGDSSFAPDLSHESSWPRISIVTPSYNQGQFLEETIRSVLLQGYPNLEYIIIDGGSTDDSVAIIKKYEPWLAYWVSEKDRGQTHAINKGFARAKGSIYYYLNSDDILFPSTLRKVAQKFAGLSHPALVSCSGRFFGPAMDRVLGVTDASPTSERAWTPPASPRLADWLSTYASLFQQSTFWDRRLHEAIGGFSEELNFCFDKDFFLRATFEFHGYVACPEIIAGGHRLHDDCKTATIPDVMVRENEKLWRQYSGMPWCQKIFRRESRERQSYELMANALHHERFATRAASLSRSAMLWPGVLRNRMFWGAVRRSLGSGRTNP